MYFLTDLLILLLPGNLKKKEKVQEFDFKNCFIIYIVLCYDLKKNFSTKITKRNLNNIENLRC